MRKREWIGVMKHVYLVSVGLAMLVAFGGCTATRSYEKGLELQSQGKFLEAYELFEKAAEKAPDNQEFKTALWVTKLKAAEQLFEEALEAERKRDLDEADRLVSKAVALAPEDDNVSILAASVRIRKDYAEELRGKAMKLAAQGEYSQAIRRLEDARLRYEGLPDGEEQLHGLRELAGADQALKRGEYAKAIVQCRSAAQKLPPAAHVDTPLRQATEQLVALHLKKAAKYVRGGLPGSAFLEYVLALALDEGNGNARTGLEMCRNALKEQLRYRIAFSGLNVPSEYARLRGRVESHISGYLEREKPGNVVIVRGTGPQGRGIRLGPEAPPGGRADAVIRGQLMSIVFSENESEARGTSTYQDGMKNVPNPEYEKIQAQLTKAQQALQATKTTGQVSSAVGQIAGIFGMGDVAKVTNMVSTGAGVAGTGAQIAVNNLQQKLDGTPPETRVPNIVPYDYRIRKVTRTVEAALEISAQDTSTGDVISSGAIRKQHSVTDDVVASDPRHNVPADPRQLPSDDVLADEVIRLILEDSKDVLDNALKSHGKRFALAASKAHQSGKEDKAVENSVAYLVAYPDGHSDTGDMIGLVNSRIGEMERRLVDFPALLGRYGRILW